MLSAAPQRNSPEAVSCELLKGMRFGRRVLASGAASPRLPSTESHRLFCPVWECRSAVWSQGGGFPCEEEAGWERGGGKDGGGEVNKTIRQI